MKYILIDTNIFLDMLIDRKNQVTNRLVESFEKLLNYDEIKVIVPAIVIHETYKHIDEELDKVRQKLAIAIKNIESLYGVNAYTIDGLNIKEYKKKSKKELQDAIEMFDSNKDAYQTEIINLINKIFQHKNTIVIEDNDKLISLCMRRRVYKKAPFHIENKDSIADGVIIETLINMNDVIEISKDDEIFFVTGNYKDFSKSEKNEDRNILHPDILDDLAKKNIADKVIYIRSFKQLITESLKDEVGNADLKEKFQIELAEQEEYLKELAETEYEDIKRERFGLSSLSEFESKLEEDLPDSDFCKSVCKIFEKMDLAYSELEEYSMFYEEELLEYFTGLDITELEESIVYINNFFHDNGLPQVAASVAGLDSIRKWIHSQINETNFVSDNIQLPDCINFGESIIFIDSDKESFSLIIDKLQLHPEDGEQEDINFYIRDSDNNEVAFGYVQVTYGYAEEDDDGGIDIACDEDIDYFTDQIEKFLDMKGMELEEFKDKHEAMVEELKKIFNL